MKTIRSLCCVLTAVGMLVPYLKYVIWALPLVFLLLEKESDFVIFMSAQMTALAAIHALLAFLIEVPLGLAIHGMHHQTAFGWALAGDLTSFLTSILAAFITLAAVILTLMAASRALKYIESHIILAAPIAEKIVALPRFRD